MERMGQEVLSVQRLTHGYQDRTLFKGCDFEMEKSERVALIGDSAVVLCFWAGPESFFSVQPTLPPWQSRRSNSAYAYLLQQDVASCCTDLRYVNVSWWVHYHAALGLPFQSLAIPLAIGRSNASTVGMSFCSAH